MSVLQSPPLLSKLIPFESIANMRENNFKRRTQPASGRLGTISSIRGQSQDPSAYCAILGITHLYTQGGGEGQGVGRAD